MKILKTIAAAGLLLSTATIATSANAQDYRYGDRYGRYDHDRGRDYDRDDRGRDHGWDRRHYGWDRGRHYGWDRGRRYGWINYRRCWTEWRWHHRVRVCN